MLAGAARTGSAGGRHRPKIKPKLVDSGFAQPASIIYIGNSFFYYNNGINWHVTQLLNAAEPGRPLRSTMVTISGSGFTLGDTQYSSIVTVRDAGPWPR